MDMFLTGAAEWAEQTFGACDLGDERRTQRLVDIGERMASQMGHSLSKCCEGDGAALLGGYRLLRNDEVKPEAIREGGFAVTARQAQEHALLLAVEDTTSVSYEHAVATQLGTTSNNPNAKRRGYQVHSVLLLDTTSERTVGLIEQTHRCREVGSYGKKHTRKQRAYEDKESYKGRNKPPSAPPSVWAPRWHTPSRCVIVNPTCTSTWITSCSTRSAL